MLRYLNLSGEGEEKNENHSEVDAGPCCWRSSSKGFAKRIRACQPAASNNLAEEIRTADSTVKSGLRFGRRCFEKDNKAELAGRKVKKMRNVQVEYCLTSGVTEFFGGTPNQLSGVVLRELLIWSYVLSFMPNHVASRVISILDGSRQEAQRLDS